MGLSCYGPLSRVEGWITGYKAEHYKLGLQMAVALCISLIGVLVNNLYKSLDRGGSVLFTTITVVVVLEPNTGDSFRKLLERCAGAGLAGGIGMLILYLAVGDDTDRHALSYQNLLSPWLVPGLAIFGFIFMVNHQRYWNHHAFWRTALFTLPAVCVPAVRSTPEYFYKGAAYRMLSIMLGIAISAAVSYVVLPVRARDLLTKKMASSLIKVGDLAVWLVGQVCVLPAPGGGGRLPGATGTDLNHIYTDDGLHAKMAPLVATASELTADLAHMGHLLEAAKAEVYLLRRPHTFPHRQYQLLLGSCHVVVGVFLSLLYALESDEVNLHVCQRHIGDLSETGVRMSAAFTALSTLIRPPKSKSKRRWWWCFGKGAKKKGKKQRQQQQQQQQAGASAASDSPAAKEAAARVAELDGEQQRRQRAKAAAAAAADGKLAPGGGGEAAGAGAPQWQPPASEHETDDPFAALSAEHAAGLGAGPSPVVSLTDSELLHAQVLARHMSAVIGRRGPSRMGRRDSDAAAAAAVADPLEPVCDEDEAAECGSPFAGGGGSSGRGGGEEEACGGGGAAGKEPLGTANSLGLSGLSSVRAGKEERLEWVQHKLRGLVDCIQALQAAAAAEREAQFVGLPTFTLIVHACTTITRQCCACFTALDPERGAELHKYVMNARSAHRSRLAVAGMHNGTP